MPELGAILARIDTGRGQEKLFLDQRPGLLRRLSENARIASITASNAIEGVVVDDERAERIVEGAPRLRNRNEKELAGYRDAVDGLMRLEEFEPLTVPLVLHRRPSGRRIRSSSSARWSSTCSPSIPWPTGMAGWRGW